MTTASDPAGPLYLDSSALAKLYLPEPGSDELGERLRRRRDLCVSDLAVTEVVSAAARRRREGGLNALAVARLHRRILRHLEDEVYVRLELAPAIHREAERLLLALDGVALRSADALHLAMATAAGIATVVTFDVRMGRAATRLGLAVAP